MRGSLSQLPATQTAGTPTWRWRWHRGDRPCRVSIPGSERCGYEWSRFCGGCVTVKVNVRHGNMYPFLPKRWTICQDVLQLRILILGTRKNMVIKRCHDGVHSRQGISYNIVLPRYMSEVSRELSNKLQVKEFSWWEFTSALLESIFERPVICKDAKVTAFDHMSNVLDGLIHCQKLAVVRSVLLLSRAELMGVESHGLPSDADTLLQAGTNSSIRSVCKKIQRSRWIRVGQNCGTGKASLAVHGGCPVYRLWFFDLGTS